MKTAARLWTAAGMILKQIIAWDISLATMS
jgi:hypothetical protein